MKLLYITSLSGKRINSFMKSAVVAAKKCGVDFTMACNMDNADLELYEMDCKQYGIKVKHIDFNRNPVSIMNVKAYFQLLEYIREEKFDVVHCNTPVGGVLGRICSRNVRIPYVIYQAHGFHFWSGAPQINWLIYYPLEKLLARYTDLLITINQEDYDVAKKFKLKKSGAAILVNGVGVQPWKRLLSKELVAEKKESLEVPKNAKILISVGELNENKNHLTAIKAFNKIDNKDLIYFICGEGKLKEELEKYVIDNNLEDKVRLLGYRTDVKELLEISDVFIFPSKREGLSAALMEAMMAEIPCVAGKIRGNIDLLPQSVLLFNPESVEELATCIEMSLDDVVSVRECKQNTLHIKKFEFDVIVDSLTEVYHMVKEQLRKEYGREFR